MVTADDSVALAATYGYMDSEHAFSAAIILLMVCASFPPDDDNIASLRSAVDLLRSMWDRGNEHIGTRYAALLRLASLIAPLSVSSGAKTSSGSLANSSDVHIHRHPS